MSIHRAVPPATSAVFGAVGRSVGLSVGLSLVPASAPGPAVEAYHRARAAVSLHLTVTGGAPLWAALESAERALLERALTEAEAASPDAPAS